MNRNPRWVQTCALQGIPEVSPGADLSATVLTALSLPENPDLADGDILVITSKIVSKAEGRAVLAESRDEAIADETVRVVASRAHRDGTGITRIVENRLGIVCAAAGVDASNTSPGTVLLLPLDPNASAKRIAKTLRERTGLTVGVIISDTLGRPWREGQTDVAIGAAGVQVFEDLRGATDSFGAELQVTLPCVADEIAAAGDLVKGKVGGTPVALVRGLSRLVTNLDAPGTSSIVRSSENDMFRLGSDEAYYEGYRDGAASAEASPPSTPLNHLTADTTSQKHNTNITLGNTP